MQVSCAATNVTRMLNGDTPAMRRKQVYKITRVRLCVVSGRQAAWPQYGLRF